MKEPTTQRGTGHWRLQAWLRIEGSAKPRIYEQISPATQIGADYNSQSLTVDMLGVEAGHALVARAYAHLLLLKREEELAEAQARFLRDEFVSDFIN